MRKSIVILSIVFVFICYIFPFFVLPFGTYTDEVQFDANTKMEITYKFKLNGELEAVSGGKKVTLYYKVKGRDVIISDDKEFNNYDQRARINSLYEIEGAVNQAGKYIAIGVEGVALLMALCLPSKKRKSR